MATVTQATGTTSKTHRISVDQYLAFTGMLAFTLGGSEIKMPEEAEEAPPPPKRKRKVESEDEEPPLGNDVKPAKGGGEDE